MLLGRDAEFAAFYLSMRAYEASLQGVRSRFILGLASEFFDF